MRRILQGQIRDWHILCAVKLSNNIRCDHNSGLFICIIIIALRIQIEINVTNFHLNYPNINVHKLVSF